MSARSNSNLDKWSYKFKRGKNKLVERNSIFSANDGRKKKRTYVQHQIKIKKLQIMNACIHTFILIRKFRYFFAGY
jgi:hypothetical protein